MAGSPVLGVLSVSLTSIRSSGPSRLIGLAGPTSGYLNRMDLPCSRRSLWLHAGGKNPGSISGRSLERGLRFRLPLCGIGSATPITIDFGAMFPFTVVPAYNLPVYASQRPLPDATQDSVRGCSLGFAAAVIADGRLRRACKAQRSSNRTGRFPASGLYGALFVKEASRHFCRPLSFHSFVRPAPQAFFRPDRIFASPSRAARSRTALLQRRRRLVLDGREHGGRLPAIGWLAAR